MLASSLARHWSSMRLGPGVDDAGAADDAGPDDRDDAKQIVPVQPLDAVRFVVPKRPEFLAAG